MKEQPVVRFENVSKRFKMSSSRPQSVLEMFIGIFRRRPAEKEELWALHDLSFDVMAGESVGIIGRNGSGKSTLLKLIARVLRPTSGQIIVGGRVSALLELGAGFHPDLTGRENVYLNGSVLGLSQMEIEDQFPSIVGFAELDNFIDVPVKHYSSGMYMRLGFSIAIHVEPDILIVDEILAVGDQAFQTKCMDRILEMKRQGTTIILVSHNLEMVRRLCSKLLWIEHGELLAVGPTRLLADQYLAATHERESRQRLHSSWNGKAKRWGTGEVEITAVRFLDGAGQEKQHFQTNDPLTIELAYEAHKAAESPEVGLAIFRQDGVHVNGPNNRAGGLEMGIVEGTGTVRYHIPRLPLLPDRYLVTVAIHHGGLPMPFDYHEQAYDFRVVAGGSEERHGLLEMEATWSWLPDGAEPVYEKKGHAAKEIGETRV